MLFRHHALLVGSVLSVAESISSRVRAASETLAASGPQRPREEANTN